MEASAGHLRRQRIYSLAEPPVATIPETATDYRSKHFDTGVPIVIDNGSSGCRVGWGSEENPRLQFENSIAKYRDRKSNTNVVVVGAETALDSLARPNLRSPFDGNVVCNFDIMESVLDYAFAKLGVDTHGVHHPVLITEPFCNPPAARRSMSELLFEGYAVPSVSYGVDSLFSYYQNGLSFDGGLIVAPGHTATHVVPIVGGKPDIEQCKRLAYGGFASTNFMLRLMQLKYPTFPIKMTVGQAQELVHRYCYVALDYLDELRSFESYDVLEEKTCIVQYPYNELQTETKSAEELERIAARRKQSGRRLQEQAAKARLEKLMAREQELEELKELRDIKDALPRKEFNDRLRRLGLRKEEEMDSHIKSLDVAVKRARNKQLGIEEEAEKEPPSFPLVDVPDDQLSEADRKEKRRQKLLKASFEARARAKAAKEEEKERQQEASMLDEQKRLNDPGKWLQEQHAARADVIERMSARKKRREALADRRSRESQIRMKSIAHLAAEEKVPSENLTPTKRRRRGKEEDTFGRNDADWAVYREISKEEEEEEEEEDTNLLQAIEGRLLEHDPSFLPSHRHFAVESQMSTLTMRLLYGLPDPYIEEGETGPEAEAVRRHKHARQHRVLVNVERCRVPEVYFQPGMIGLDQAGVSELLADIIRRVDPLVRDSMIQNVFLAGGPSRIPSFDERIARDLRMILPPGAPLRVYRAKEPETDPWRGAALWTRREEDVFRRSAVTRREYDELGPDYMKDHKFYGSWNE